MRLRVQICLIFLVESYATNDDCCEPNRGECIETGLGKREQNGFNQEMKPF